LVGTPRLVIALADLGTHPGLVNEFDGGQEIIQEEAQGTVDGRQGLVFCGGVETGVADIVPDVFQVFLFDETGIVFLVRAGSGKSAVEGIAPEPEGGRNKLRAVIAVDAPKGKGRLFWMSGRASKTHFGALLGGGLKELLTKQFSGKTRNRSQAQQPFYAYGNLSKNLFRFVLIGNTTSLTTHGSFLSFGCFLCR
jgi:hypothetical protein